MRSILDPRLMGALVNVWPSRCTIQEIATSDSDSGQPVPTGASDVSGHINLPCRLGPLVEIRPTDNASLSYGASGRFTRRQLKLAGYFPSINPDTMQAVVDGVTYPIRGIESDSQNFSTRLLLDLVTP
jgi:hypothetical protein